VDHTGRGGKGGGSTGVRECALRAGVWVWVGADVGGRLLVQLVPGTQYGREWGEDKTENEAGGWWWGEGGGEGRWTGGEETNAMLYR
jgi:hypothetical protein